MSKHFLNVKRILGSRGLKKEDLADKLFPNVKYPVRALYRIVSGEAELSASQVSILAQELNCEIQDLYEPDRWIWQDTKDGNIIFIYGKNFRVQIDTDSWRAIIYYKDEIVEKGIICDDAMPIGEFFKSIRAKIQNYIELM